VAKRWEIAEQDWDQVVEEVRAELRSVARRGGTISYSELVSRVPRFSGPDSRALAAMLGEVNEQEPPYEGGPLLISAAVTHKDDKYPGVGFFTVASHLGMTVPNDDAGQRIFWAHELERVHRAYGRGGDR
jgi:hypothetical protein